ncbi:MAG: metallophosphoesterase [Candidatus Marinimicrobia bacterium]|nr:metallophosphoesterase [Candidatus Neomarinimicrobiota bacterium]
MEAIKEKGNSVRIAFLADTHLGFDFPLRPRIDRRRRGPDFFNNFNRALEMAVNHGADVVVHGGDVFFRSKIPEAIIAKAYEPLLPMADSGLPILLVPGNHERSVLPASPLFHHPNIHVFKSPCTRVLNFRGYQIAMGGFPNVRHQAGYNFPRILDETGLLDTVSDVKILCMHQSVDGAQVGPVNFTFRKGRDVIGRDQIPEEIPLVLSGHIHRHQILKLSSNGYVVYSGSIDRTSFSEKAEKKGFYLIDVDLEPSLKFIFNFMELDTRPMFDLIVPENLSHREETLAFVQTRIREFPANSIVRVVPAVDQQSIWLGSATLRMLSPDTMNVDLKYNRGEYQRDSKANR